MTDRFVHRSRTGAGLFAAVMLVGAAALTSCAGRTVEAPMDSLADEDLPAKGMNSGTFPNLNIPPQVAAEQLTQEQSREKRERLEAERNRIVSAGAGTHSSVDPAQVKKLGETHGREALEAIENN